MMLAVRDQRTAKYNGPQTERAMSFGIQMLLVIMAYCIGKVAYS